jgi:hypothetical protein
MSDPAELEVYEVFKTANVRKQDVDAMSLEEIQEKFTILSPVVSKLQISDATTLATVPKPGSWHRNIYLVFFFFFFFFLSVC